jgi:hypothetical protein
MSDVPLLVLRESMYGTTIAPSAPGLENPVQQTPNSTHFLITPVPD